MKSLDSFQFTAIPSLNKSLVLELARCAYVEGRENIIALGLAACQKGLSRRVRDRLGSGA